MPNSTRITLAYFLALEKDLLRYSRYVEFAADNFRTYSLEFGRLLLAAGSEVDVACKELCRLVDPEHEPRTIQDFASILLKPFPVIESEVVQARRYDLSFEPWKGWTQEESPPWWKAYNQVKHDRLQSSRDGNLGNVLNAVAGLGVIMGFFGTHLFPKWNFTGELFDLNFQL
jgi:hypothetical protein